jgi:hypothetical protein
LRQDILDEKVKKVDVEAFLTSIPFNSNGTTQKKIIERQMYIKNDIDFLKSYNKKVPPPVNGISFSNVSTSPLRQDESQDYN